MKKIVLYNQNGQKFDVDVVRYFKNNENNYLIFSLDEKDNNGYSQLYLSKVEDIDGKFVMSNVSDPKEWDEFRSSIQKIVMNNKNNIPNNGDMDPTVLEGSTVSEFRIFKLKNEVVDMLSKNITLPKETKKETEPVDLQSASAQDTGMSIEEILKQVSEGAKSAREVTKVDLNDKKKKLTIEDLINKEKEKAKNAEPEVLIPSAPIKEEIEEEELEVETKPIITESKPDESDYITKYNEALNMLHHLEEENLKLINELIEAKAKLETIKDILN